MEQAMLGRYEKFWTPGQPKLNPRGDRSSSIVAIE